MHVAVISHGASLTLKHKKTKWLFRIKYEVGLDSGRTEICSEADQQVETVREQESEREMLIKNMPHKPIDEYANVPLRSV